MTNPYYQPGAQRAAKVVDLFARIAPRYDLINDLQSFGLHRWWKRRLVRLSAPRPHERALDLCCGTGDLAFAFARQGVEAVGLDFSEPMLRIAEQRKAALRDSSSPHAEVIASHLPHFLAGDAQQIPFENDSFDIVTVSYGLRNLADWTAGLGEMLRVARPGGRLLVLDFGKPDNRLWRALYFAYLRAIVPCFGKLFCHDAHAYAYILESLQPYPAQRGVEARMRELGCRDVRVVQFLRGVMSINLGTKP
jgi:demethylmenaquinone methyltransferase / 2-methoxy-6-polyprenyl-1,4-benzoquinol methylase